MALITEYHVEARRSPHESWTNWTKVEDPRSAEEHLANVKAAGFEGQIVKKIYEGEPL